MESAGKYYMKRLFYYGDKCVCVCEKEIQIQAVLKVTLSIGHPITIATALSILNS